MSYVLITDDEPDSCEIVQRRLEKEGYKIRIATTGRAALAQLSHSLPAAVILDVRMPEMDGIELLEVMRSYLRWYETPVILMTAHASKDEETRARELGVERVFRKSQFRLNDLVDYLKDVAPAAMQ
jgi:two-component system response regulator AtoC